MKSIFIEALRNNPSYETALKKIKFKRGQIITNYINNRSNLFIIERGTADLMRHDYNGNKIIVDRHYENDMFGEIFYNIITNNELFVIAKEETIIYEIDYKLLQQFNNFEDINKILNKLMLEKIIHLNEKLELITKTTTRDKLLFYFSNLSRKNYNNKKIRLPFSYSDLAAYLSINRSSMMREIKILIEEGFIEKSGKYINLYY